MTQNCTELRPSAHPYKAYIDEFLTWKRKVEDGIRNIEPELVQTETLKQAENSLYDLDNDLDPDLNDIQIILEEKLDEIIEAINGKWCSGNARKLPPELNPPNKRYSDSITTLHRKISRRQRNFLFIGMMREILHQYRDEGLALIVERRNVLLEKLESAAETFGGVIRSTQRHIVIDQYLSPTDRQQIEKALSQNASVARIFRTIATERGDIGVAAMLENNGQQLRTQYVAACAHVCLRLYGHVTPDILHRLLGLKSSHYLERWAPGGLHGRERAADQKQMSRLRGSALKRALKQAEQESWLSLPILKFYAYDPHFFLRRRETLT